MKKITSLFFFFLSLNLSAQIEGTWNGNIEIPNNCLPLILHITNENNQLKASFDSPNQGAFGIEIPEVKFEEKQLTFKFTAMTISYTGTLNNQTITGKFTQGGQSFPLNLTKGTYVQNRPQEPQPPFNYKVENVQFENKKAGIKLAGTLTTPNQKEKYPAVILVSGSGANDRNEELFNHKPFLVLADYLTKNGYAVLRYDKRGVAASEGDFSEATISDFTEDAEAALDFLRSQKNIDVSKMGILGHSEGGIVAQKIAAKNKNIAFIISMAGPGIDTDQLMLIQKSTIEKQMGVPEITLKMNEKLFGSIYKILKKDISASEAENEIIELIGKNPMYKFAPKEQTKQLSDLAHSAWFREFISYEPYENLGKINSKVLVINGDKDVQVTATENIEGWKKGLIHNKKASFKIYPNLNHLFQEAQTGMPNEYGKIETTIEPYVLEDMVNWLNVNVK